MNNSVWKYQIPVANFFTLYMPDKAKVLDVQTQRGVPVMWAQVDINAKLQPRSFHLIGTGHPLEISTCGYIGSFQTNDEELVFHLFEVTQS